MISDEKMSHVVHLILDALEKAGLAKFARKDEAIREARKVGNKFLSGLAEVDGIARSRIASQKNAPPEYSSQWQILYQKYYEEEMRKRGG